MRVTLVAAMSRTRAIGRGGRLLWHLPRDLARFRTLTLGKPVVMGRRTYESIGGALPGRANLVVTRGGGTSVAAPAQACASVEEALARAGDAPEAMVIGGSRVYSESLSRATRAALTLVDSDAGGDRYFPVLGPEWREVERERFEADARNAHAMTFVTLEREGGRDA